MIALMLSGCGMMFKNHPTPTKIVNDTNGKVTVLDSNNKKIGYIEPNDSMNINQKKAIKLSDEANKSKCRVDRDVNIGVVALDILASLFVPLWPVTIPIIWITDGAGGYLRDNVQYVETSSCLDI